MKKLKIILTLFLFSQLAFAQEQIVHGVVKDSIGPIPGVNVVVKGTRVGTQTDFDGNYEIIAKMSDTLIFSFVAMKDKKIVADKTEINVVLEKTDNYDSLMGEIPRQIERPIKHLPQLAEYNPQKNSCKDCLSKYKSELKQDTFLEILKKKEDGKVEFISGGFSNPDLLECSFIETIRRSLKNKNGKKTFYIFKTVEYRFSHQKLYFKIVCFYDKSGDISHALNIDYYGKTKTLLMSKTHETCRIDKRGNIVSAFNSNSYDIEKRENFIFERLNSALPKLQKMRDEVRKIIGKYDLVKPYEKYNVNEWKTLNKISEYLKKELNIQTNLYFKGMDKDILALITEYGEYYEYSLFNKRVEHIEHGYYIGK